MSYICLMEKVKEKILDCFKELSFEEESHTYFVRGNPLETSVSGIVHKFVVEVDYESISYRIDKREGLPPGTTNKIWDYKKDAACAVGSKAHFFGEIYAFHRNLEPDSGFERAICKFWKDLPDHIVVVFAELQMYHLIKMFGGTADIILYNTRTGKFIIADYKTNEDLFKNWRGKRLRFPFHNFIECPFNEYQIQFSLYQILLEQTGVEVERRVLVYLEPNGEYSLYDAQDLTQTLRKHLDL